MQLVSKGCWKLLTNHGKEGDDLSFLSHSCASVLHKVHNSHHGHHAFCSSALLKLCSKPLTLYKNQVGNQIWDHFMVLYVEWSRHVGVLPSNLLDDAITIF